VYGAGHIGCEVAAVLSEHGVGVRAFIDINGDGEFAGRRVYPPDAELLRAFASEGLTVVIGVFNFSVDPWPIHRLLAEAGFQRIVSFNEFQEIYRLRPHFWLTSRTHIAEQSQRIREGWDVLADEPSRQIFLDAIRLRLTHDIEILRSPSLGHQYLPEGLPWPRMPLRMIDGGAFTGDTVQFLLAQGIRFEALAAFEPDPGNFRLLQETIRENIKALGDVTLWPCGTSDGNSIAPFLSGKGAGSTATAGGDISIPLVALDAVLPTFAPTFIKLDIEGSEIATLHGAAAMIRIHQPSMAVCVYHRPDHLWEIPILLRALLPSHHIVLRYHTYQAFDLVAYAFPPQLT